MQEFDFWGDLEGCLSRRGSSTQLKSPPIITLVLEMSGIMLKTFWKKSGFSKLGAYIFTNVVGTEFKVPATIRSLPFGSLVIEDMIKGIFFLIKIATPLALVVKLDSYNWSTQLTSSFPLAVCLMCVSWRNIISADRDFKCANTSGRFIIWPRPLIATN